jgi:serine/threonine-protein kinase
MPKNESQGVRDLGKATSSFSEGKQTSSDPERNRGDSATSRGSSRTELPPKFGRYRVKEKLGSGGMGTVYLVENSELEREEALKVPQYSDDDSQWRERFIREAKSAARLHHPNLCPVYDAGVRDGIYYLTMPFLNGKALSELRGRALPTRKAVEIVTKLADALEYAHGKDVIHRDLKPANVMMVGGVGPVVMDFGLAKQVRKVGNSLTERGDKLGTPAYMPPEQVLGELEQMGPTCDVYSLGVILFELLTGRLPFEGAKEAIYGQILYVETPLPSAFVPGLDPALDAICRKAMAKTPTDRYPSMKAFATDLKGFLRSMPAAAGGGDVKPSAVGKPAIFQATTVAPSPRPGGKAANFQTPTVAPRPQTGNQASPPLVKPATFPTDPSWPTPKPSRPPVTLSRKIWRAVKAVAALFILFVIVGIAAILYDVWATARRATIFGPENFQKLNAGMTRAELESILGAGETATEQDLHFVGVYDWAGGQRSDEGSTKGRAWRKAVSEGRVLIWRGGNSRNWPPAILAAFPGEPSSASTVDVVLRNGNSGEYTQKPADKWVVNKDNFLKLRLGMTLKEVEDIIGAGTPVGSAPQNFRWDAGWSEAAKEYRVYRWSTGTEMLACFSAPPSAATAAKVEALIYRDGKWDEDKGTVSVRQK